MNKIFMYMAVMLLSFNLSGASWDFQALGISFSTPDEVVGMAVPDNQITSKVRDDVPLQIFSGFCEDYSVTVTALYAPLEPLIFMPEDLLLELWSSDPYMDFYESMNIKIKDISVYHVGILDTIRYNMESDASGYRTYTMMYQTIVNQYCLTFGIAVDYRNRQHLEAIAEEIMDSLRVIGTGKTPDCFNPEIMLMSNTSFICPEDCYYTYFIDGTGAFIYRGDELIITMMENDIYLEMTPYEQLHTDRSDVNNDMYPPSDMAFILDLPASAVRTEKIGGREWYRIDGYNGGDTIAYCRIYDGYLDLFFAEENNVQTLKAMFLTMADA